MPSNHPSGAAFGRLDTRLTWLHPAKLSIVEIASLRRVSDGYVHATINPIRDLRSAAPETIEGRLYGLFADESRLGLGLTSGFWKRHLEATRMMINERVLSFQAQRAELETDLTEIAADLRRGVGQRGRRKKVLDVPAGVA